MKFSLAALAALLPLTALGGRAVVPTPAPEEDFGLTGDWGGWRQRIHERGIDITANYTGEVSGIVTGGIQRGAVYNGLVELSLNLDFGRIFGWEGLSAHACGFYPHGKSGSAFYAGDLSTFSNIDFYDSYRLYEAWLQSEFLSGKVALRAGLLAVDEEFAYGGTDSMAVFLNASFGSDIDGSSNFPVPSYGITAPGISLRLEPWENLTFRAALYDGNPATGVSADPTPGARASTEFNHYGTHWALRSEEGALMVFELGYELNPPPAPSSDSPPTAPADGKTKLVRLPERGLAGTYKVGLLYHTDEFGDIREQTLTDLESPLAPSKIGQHSGLAELYFAIDQELWRHPENENQGLRGFFRASWSPENRSFVHFGFETGVVYLGLIPGRPDDVLGFGFAYAKISEAVSEAVKSANRFDDGARAVPNSESVLELTYNAKITPWMSVQPDLQYIIDPGAYGESDNALVLTLRTSIAF